MARVYESHLNVLLCVVYNFNHELTSFSHIAFLFRKFIAPFRTVEQVISKAINHEQTPNEFGNLIRRIL